MPDEDTSSVATPKPARSASSHQKGTREKLSALFSQVNALAIGLKQISARRQHEGSLPAGGQSVLEILKRCGPRTVPQIAGLRSTSRQNIQILVNRLRAEGCVELMSNPGHRRSALVCLTREGRDWLVKSEDRESDFVRSISSHVPAGDLSSAREILTQVQHLLAGAGVQTPSAGRTGKQQARVRPAGAEGRVPEAASEKPHSRVADSGESGLGEYELPVNLL